MSTEAKNQCSGDCRNCHPAQRVYCSSQIAYNNMKLIESMQSELESLKQEIVSMKGSGDDGLINPTEAQ